jgi:hypothetical protein
MLYTILLAGERCSPELWDFYGWTAEVQGGQQPQGKVIQMKPRDFIPVVQKLQADLAQITPSLPSGAIDEAAKKPRGIGRGHLHETSELLLGPR